MRRHDNATSGIAYGGTKSMGRTQLDQITHAIHDVVDRGLLKVVFQPIVDLGSGTIFGYEALARSLSPEIKRTTDLFRAAVEAGRIGDLGRLLRDMAVRGCPDANLFFNIVPNEFEYPWLVRPDDAIFRHKRAVYLEITESVPISHFEQCQSMLSEVRKKGVLLAIDDLGAGFSNLKYIADLTPDIVKLDRDLIAGVEPGTRSAKLLTSIVDLCKGMGAKLVAEGVETKEEFDTVTSAGADFCQGFYLARPSDQPAIAVRRF